MKALDAAHEVLRDAGEPLHYAEIARRMLERGLWKTAGLTPRFTVSRDLSGDIREHGAASRFRRTGPGVFALRHAGEEEPPPPAARSARQGAMSFADAAEEVLRRADALHRDRPCGDGPGTAPDRGQDARVHDGIDAGDGHPPARSLAGRAVRTRGRRTR